MPRLRDTTFIAYAVSPADRAVAAFQLPGILSVFSFLQFELLEFRLALDRNLLEILAPVELAAFGF